VIHDGMTCDPIQGQGQGHGGLKCAKIADFKSYLSASFQLISQYAALHRPIFAALTRSI